MTEFERIYSIKGNLYRNKCIDGKITGITKCVGYCKYSEHSGFLTEKNRKNHSCIEKNCFHYVPREKTIVRRKESIQVDEVIPNIIKEKLSVFEGMKVMKVSETDNDIWKVNYITISNDYPLESVIDSLSEKIGCVIVLNRLDYDFEVCSELIFN